jgi:hypothetical protein
VLESGPHRGCFGSNWESVMKSIRAFMLVNKMGYPMPCSGSLWATGVRQWADKEYGGDGYESAKAHGWRVKKVMINPVQSETKQ